MLQLIELAISCLNNLSKCRWEQDNLLKITGLNLISIARDIEVSF